MKPLVDRAWERIGWCIPLEMVEDIIEMAREEFAQVAERYRPDLDTCSDIPAAILVDDIAEAIRKHETGE